MKQVYFIVPVPVTSFGAYFSFSFSLFFIFFVGKNMNELDR